MKVKLAQLCLTLCYPRDYTVHGILQTRILERVAVPFFRGSSQPRDRIQVSHIAGGFESRSPTLQVDCLPAEPSGKPPSSLTRDQTHTSCIESKVLTIGPPWKSQQYLTPSARTEELWNWKIKNNHRRNNLNHGGESSSQVLNLFAPYFKLKQPIKPHIM